MTKGPWKFEWSDGHCHVVMSDDEVLDVLTEDDAKAIAEVPDLLKLLQYVHNVQLDKAFNIAAKINKRLRRKR